MLDTLDIRAGAAQPKGPYRLMPVITRTRLSALVLALVGAVLVLTTSDAPADAAVHHYVYGQTVDQVDTVGTAPGSPPPMLPVRPQGTLTFGGNYSQPCSGCLSGDYLMFFQGQDVTITGTGYFSVAWEVGYGNNNGPGQLVMPRWTGLTGRLFHVASGGGHRMDDLRPDFSDGTTWMGQVGYSDTLPAGAQQMWQDEYYHLHGSVTLHDTENAIDYDLSVTPTTASDIDSALSSTSGLFVRYGIVRDTGNNTAPVPQYVTRAHPTDYPGYSSVAQQSSLETLSAPTHLVAAPGVSKVRLQWGAPVSAGASAVTGYQVQKRRAGTSWVSAGHTSTRSRTVTALRNGVARYFRVRAVNSNRAGPWSPAVRAVPRARH